jgi:hypothetical protein
MARTHASKPKDLPVRRLTAQTPLLYASSSTAAQARDGTVVGACLPKRTMRMNSAAASLLTRLRVVIRPDHLNVGRRYGSVVQG